MKLSLLLTALIVAAFYGYGRTDLQRISAARLDHDRLVAEAQALGIDTADLSGKDKTPRLSKLQRDRQTDKEAQTKAYAAKLIAFANELQEMQKSGRQPDQEMQKRIFDIIDGMLQLDPSQLKQLVADLKTASGLDDEMRRNIIGFAIMTLANDHPAAALALYTESSDLSKDGNSSSQVVAAALTTWAQRDPMAALDWIRKNSTDHPELVNEKTKSAVIAGTAKQDPKLAFSLLGELGLIGNSQTVSSIVDAATTPAARTAVLAAMRDSLASTTDETARQSILGGKILQSLANNAMAGGFDGAADWLKNSALTKDETTQFANDLSTWQAKDDTGKWIDWMSDKLPPDQLKQKVTGMMDQWTRQDYKAAGTWINDAPAGPAKDAAAASYASAVAPYEPETAAQWAQTLPPGQDRDNLLKNVYSEWKKKDPGAAAAFAKSNGIPE